MENGYQYTPRQTIITDQLYSPISKLVPPQPTRQQTPTLRARSLDRGVKRPASKYSPIVEEAELQTSKKKQPQSRIVQQKQLVLEWDGKQSIPDVVIIKGVRPGSPYVQQFIYQRVIKKDQQPQILPSYPRKNNLIEITPTATVRTPSIGQPEIEWQNLFYSLFDNRNEKLAYRQAVKLVSKKVIIPPRNFKQVFELSKDSDNFAWSQTIARRLAQQSQSIPQLKAVLLPYSR